MAYDSDLEARQAEIELLEAKIRELKTKRPQSRRALGRSLGVDLTPDDFTPEIVALCVHQVCAALRRSGYEMLAEKYLSKFLAFQGADGHLRQLTAQHSQALEIPFTEAERAELVAARSVANNCQEHFERVHAEAAAVFE